MTEFKHDWSDISLLSCWSDFAAELRVFKY